MKAKGEEIKAFMKKGDVKKSISDDITAFIRGGNTSDTLDIGSVTDDEMDEIWKTDMRIFKLNDTAFRKLKPKAYKDLMEKHKTTKTTAESLILKRNKK